MFTSVTDCLSRPIVEPVCVCVRTSFRLALSVVSAIACMHARTQGLVLRALGLASAIKSPRKDGCVRDVDHTAKSCVYGKQKSPRARSQQDKRATSARAVHDESGQPNGERDFVAGGA